MHNLKELRKDLDNIKKKFEDRNINFDVKKFIEKDTLNRDLISKKEKLEQEKKSLSKSKDQSNYEKSKKISQEIINLTKKQTISQKEIDKILFSLPNLARDDVPVGKDEHSNTLIKKKGEIKTFPFKIKSHVELGAKEQNIDFETSIKLSG